MSTVEFTEYQSVWEKVQSWPPDMRLTLAESVLGSLRGDVTRQGSRGLPAAMVRGIAATGQPPPTDEQVEGWLEDRRMRK